MAVESYHGSKPTNSKPSLTPRGASFQLSIERRISMPRKEPKKIRGIFERPKGSGIWWIRYADEFGKIHREKVGMRSRALEVYQQRKTEIRLGKFKPQDVKGKHNNAGFVEIVEDRVAVAKGLRSFRDELQHLTWRTD